MEYWEYPPLPHDYPYYRFIWDPKPKQEEVKVTNFKKLPKVHILEFCKKLNTRHTFWSCLKRYVNMKWIRLVLWKIQSEQDLFYRRTDGQTDKVKPVYPPQLRWRGYNEYVLNCNHSAVILGMATDNDTLFHHLSLAGPTPRIIPSYYWHDDNFICFIYNVCLQI